MYVSPITSMQKNRINDEYLMGTQCLIDEEPDSLDDTSEYKNYKANNDEVIAIMDRYHEAKDLKEKSGTIVREVLRLDEIETLPKIINASAIRGFETKFNSKNIVDATTKAVYDKAVCNYNKSEEIMANAKENMIESLSKFIYYIIERNFNTFKKYTADLYQEGVLGILKGFERYDARKSRPTTYFYVFIVHEMTEFVNQNVNKTTSHYSANIVKVKKAINNFEHEGREWTIKDIAQETGISAETILQSIRIMDCSQEVHYDSVDYLDSQISQRCSSPEEEYLKNETAEIIHQAVAALSEDEAKVIIAKYGLDGKEGRSFKNISIELGIQIDKVKKLNNAAIRKLKKSKLIHGNFNLAKEEKALNTNAIGYIPVEAGEKLMQELENIQI